MKKYESKIIRLKNNESIQEEINWERKNDVTVEEVKATFEEDNLSQEQAEEIIHFIKNFSMLLHNLLAKEMTGAQATIISFETKKKNNKAA